MTFLEDLGWWGVALVLAIALAALVVLIVATVGGVRRARRAAEAEQAHASGGSDGEPTVATSESTDATAPESDEVASYAATDPKPETLDPLQALQLRYARGEIERDEYLQRRADLEGR